MWWNAFGGKKFNPFEGLPLGVLLILMLLATVVWAVINYGMTHLLIWWIGV